jgi:hypothetical protein
MGKILAAAASGSGIAIGIICAATLPITVGPILFAACCTAVLVVLIIEHRNSP